MKYLSIAVIILSVTIMFNAIEDANNKSYMKELVHKINICASKGSTISSAVINPDGTTKGFKNLSLEQRFIYQSNCLENL